MTPPKPARRPVIYAASRASVAARGALWRALRADGAAIVSTWIDEDGAGATASFSDLWLRIEAEVRSADRLVLYVEPDDFPLKGAYIEAGMALALGKPVWVVAPGVVLDPRDYRPLGSWAAHPLVHFGTSIRRAVGLKDLAEESTHGAIETVEPPPSSGGSAVVVNLTSRLGLALSASQADSLWAECRQYLKTRKLANTVREAEASLKGSLDTLPRGDVQSAIAQLLAGRDWPLNCSTRAETQLFEDAFRKGVTVRGYGWR